MKRVYLFCSAGMSTSLVASRMQAVADDHNLPIEVKAFSDSKLDIIVEQYHPDVILLGPQVKYKFNWEVTGQNEEGSDNNEWRGHQETITNGN